MVINSAVSNFPVDTAGKIWAARITPSVNGTAVTINVPVNAAQDQAGNASTAARASANYTAPLSAPVGFTASPGDGQAALSWAAPVDSANTAAVTKYQYRYQAGSSVTTGTWTDVADGGDAGSDVADETAVTVTGLINGAQYAFELRAVNGAGNGAAATATATPASSDTTAPQVTSITRQSPSSSPTNADSLTWRVTFSEPVQNVDAADFQVSNTTAMLSVSQVTGMNAYDVTASGGNLAGLDTPVTLSFNSNHNIQDTSSNALASSPTPRGTNNNSFVVQNTSTLSPTPPPTAPTPVVSISAGAPSVTEGDAISFTLSATPPPEAGATITVNINVAEDGSVAASGQTCGRPVTISTSGLASFTVATNDDTIYEPDGNITATVQAGAGYRPHSSNASAAVSVKDNDSPGLLDPRLMQAWLIRFGRTVSHEVVAALQNRFAADPPQPGLHLTVAGEEFINATALAENQQVLAKALGFETVTGHQWVEGSAFSFAPSADGTTAQFAIWGQGALASFSGAEDSLSLDGDVSTALLGAEWRAARWLAGAALSQSWGSGGYAEDNTVAGGDISSTLTGIFPYGRYRLTPRLGIWAVAGYGWGDLSLKPDGDGTDYSPGITMVMTAVGIDGLLLDGGAEGLSLTTTADALTVQTTSEAVAGLASSDANISRLRLGLGKPPGRSRWPTALLSSPPWNWASAKTVAMRKPASAWSLALALPGPIQSVASALSCRGAPCSPIRKRSSGNRAWRSPLPGNPPPPTVARPSQSATPWALPQRAGVWMPCSAPLP